MDDSWRRTRIVARSKLTGKPRLARAEGATGAVTLVQRFGSALNLNIHFHMLFLDGAYLTGTHAPVFRRIAAPSARELQALVEGIAERIGHALERKGLIVRDCDNRYLSFDFMADGALNDFIGHSITYRIAVGPRTGQKVFTLQALPQQLDDERTKAVAQTSGFSLHAGIGIEAEQREKLIGFDTDTGMQRETRSVRDRLSMLVVELRRASSETRASSGSTTIRSRWFTSMWK